MLDWKNGQRLMNPKGELSSICTAKLCMSFLEGCKLLEKSEDLEELSGTKYVLHPSDEESFLELKHLQVRWSPKIQYVIDSKDQQFVKHGAFPLLESLVLEWLDNLEEVSAQFQ
ncbi:hypothetical protein CK203_040389 [Vitis vinifera]|uniref:Uncharacterized protein n=1 Tax=Vitis vinifera TaxID=29760 RepID=A0A438FWY5_VITVI|nr:hypothetical protein CK203_040389 [Vitis vinifera]